MDGRGLSTEGEDTPHPRAPSSPAVGVAAPRDGRSASEITTKTHNSNRKLLIESQLKNKYSPKSLPPFIVFVECYKDSNDEGSNFGNMHPMAIARFMCVICGDSNIVEIKGIGKMIQEITFGTFGAANDFIERRGKLPKEWSVYIPNFKVRSRCGARS